MDDSVREYEEKVKDRVLDLVRRPDSSLTAILNEVEGADPRLVQRFLTEARAGGRADSLRAQDRSAQPGDAAAYEDLPAADPLLGQWWYTSDTLERLSRRVNLLAGAGPTLNVLCLGTPTIAPRLAEEGKRVTLIDADPDVLDVVGRYSKGAVTCINSESLEEIQRCLGAFDACLLDPPWYPEEMHTFFEVASACVHAGGRAYASLPQLLTRPLVFEERQQLLKRVADAGHSVLFLERNCLRYVVPRFEEAAFQDIRGFSGRPWRQADLLELTIGAAQASDSVPALSKPITAERYSRTARDFRVFMRSGGGAGGATKRAVVQEIKSFSQNISRRAHGDAYPDVWTSEKTGVSVEDLDEARTILKAWAAGCTLEDTAKNLAAVTGTDEATAQGVCGRYDEILGLWHRFAGGSGRRTADDISEKKALSLSEWATEPTAPEHARPGDGFRSIFSRDRDRVLWSGSLRKLAAKTQLFPAQEGDQLRQRLAHSLEVMQLASTIGDSFGLNRELIEAGSIAHDIGHTPFGHAGEHALHTTLKRISQNLPGFNHYEHGVDVVRYLEGPYQHVGGGGHPGLNLSPEVCECIFKHTYCHVGQSGSHEALRRVSKHKGYLKDGFCHFEGQAVRLADKISYLISDLEDGIRLGAIDDGSLLGCRLFHRPPIELARPEGESLLNRFLYQRRNILRVLMEDAISETARRLTGVKNSKAIRSHDKYLVDHSPVVSQDVSEIWHQLQVERLHHDPRVVAANLKSAKIVSELLLLFSVVPELIDSHFLKEHQRLWQGPYLEFYRQAGGQKIPISERLVRFLSLRSYIGLEDRNKSDGHAEEFLVAIEDLVVAKDYVASMTDDQARRVHRLHLGSSAESG